MAWPEAQTMKHKIIIAGIFVTGSQALSAADRAMPDEAKAMLKNALAHYQSVGRKQALADFSAKKPPFADRELYLVCIGPGHLISAHGAFPQYVAPGRLSERRRGQTAWDGHRGCGVEARWRLGALHDDQSDKRQGGAEDNVRAE